jgi:hypothetical protein
MRIWRTRAAIGGPIMTLAWLAACSLDPAQMPAWELAGHPGLLYQIKVYYEQNAFEEYGRCRDPIFVGLSRSQVLAEDDQEMVVGLQYLYRDYIRDRVRPTGFRECVGYAGRTFTIAKNEAGLKVVEMDGPQRGLPPGSTE